MGDKRWFIIGCLFFNFSGWSGVQADGNRVNEWLFADSLNISGSVTLPADLEAEQPYHSDYVSSYQMEGDYGSAFEVLYRALVQAEQRKDSLRLGQLKLKIGELYQELNNYETGRWYLEEAERISRNQNDLATLRESLLRLGMNEREMEKFGSSEAYLMAARELEDENPVSSIRIVYNLGLLDVQRGELARAGRLFTEVLEQSRRAGFEEGIFHAFMGLGEVERVDGRYLNAVDWFDSALESARSIGANVLISEVLEERYNTYRDFGETDLALSALEDLYLHNERVRSLEHERSRAEYETLLETRRQEQRNQVLTARQAEQEARLRLQQAIGIGGLALLSVLLGMTVVLYRNGRIREQMNDELEEKNRELDQLNGVKDRLFSVISHDLRGPLHSLQGLLQLFRSKRLDEEGVRRLAEQLETQVKGSQSVLENLLAWSRSQMDGIQVQPVEFELSRLVDELIGQIETQAKAKGVVVSNKIDPSLIVRADRDMVRLLLRNFVSNAVKFSSKGDQIVVKTQEDEDQLRISVRDTGAGIAPEIQQKLLNGEVHTSRGTKKEKGSGLGLQLCREFAAKQGGDMGFESLQGEGSTFWFTLPAVSVMSLSG